MSDLLAAITACECCEGLTVLTPQRIFNRPGLSRLDYRVGTHATFKASMITRLSGGGVQALRQLTTRDAADPTLALLDVWAVVLDVLTFYQERIAHEAYLRTAVERRSILELARLIGYELRPGVAAASYLAFTLDDAPSAPAEVVIPPGTRAQSLPVEDEPPQPFETRRELRARPQWNVLRPRRARPQELDLRSGPGVVYLQGTANDLEAGDALLAVKGATPLALLRVLSADVAATGDHTRIEVTVVNLGGAVNGLAPTARRSAGFVPGRQPLTAGTVAAALGGLRWSSGDLLALVQQRGWELSHLNLHFTADGRAAPAPSVEVHALRVRARFFGHNAPRYETLPTEIKGKSTNWDDQADPQKIDQAGNDTSWIKYRELYHRPHDVVLLENNLPGILNGSWAVITGSGQSPRVLRVIESDEVSRADFTLSANVTRLELGSLDQLSGFKLRDATIHARSERLELAEQPIDKPVAGTTLELASVQFDLVAGRTLVLTGERDDLAGVVASEVVKLLEVEHDTRDGVTVLTFARELDHRYRRDTVTLNANVAAATHGETVDEVLGSGDAAQRFQRFRLRQSPLTYTSAAVPSGAESSLELRVDGIRWHESPDLFRLGPHDRGYVLRQRADGTSEVLFGDGVKGARLPTGVENVAAVYRKGLGLGGQVGENRITLLARRPLGVRSVTNPVAAAGAEDPETVDSARRNAPLTVLTLDRIVSLRDFADFARAFGGIGKAHAAWTWDGSSRRVFVTVAGADGGPVDPRSALYHNLADAIDRARAPFQDVVVASFESVTFDLAARVRTDPDRIAARVLEDVEGTLRRTFAFAARDFGQPVALSEVMATIQNVAGVVAVDVDAFYAGATPVLAARIVALPPRLEEGALRPAQLVTITPGALRLGEMP